MEVSPSVLTLGDVLMEPQVYYTCIVIVGRQGMLHQRAGVLGKESLLGLSLQDLRANVQIMPAKTGIYFTISTETTF